MIDTGAASQEVLDAYIRGEIEAGDLVTAYLARHPPHNQVSGTPTPSRCSI